MTYKEEFIKFMSDSGVLTFGDFTLKSGTPLSLINLINSSLYVMTVAPFLNY